MTFFFLFPSKIREKWTERVELLVNSLCARMTEVAYRPKKNPLFTAINSSRDGAPTCSFLEAQNVPGSCE